MLYNLVHDIYHLPIYLHRGAMEKIVVEWRGKNSLVNDVACGRTSFEETVRPLAEEHLKLNFLGYGKERMKRDEFQKLAQTTERRFSGVLSLDHTSFWGRAGNITSGIIDLPPSSISTTLAWLIGLTSLVIIITVLALRIEALVPLLVGSLMGITVSAGIIMGPRGVLEHRDIARMVLGRAKFLDDMFRLVKATESK